MALDVIYYLNTSFLHIEGLKNEETGAYINDATGTITMVDSDGVNVPGQSWPTNVNAVGGTTTGEYTAAISHALTVTVNAKYYVKLTMTSGVIQGYWELPVTVRLRRAHVQ